MGLLCFELIGILTKKHILHSVYIVTPQKEQFFYSNLCPITKNQLGA